MQNNLIEQKRYTNTTGYKIDNPRGSQNAYKEVKNQYYDLYLKNIPG